MEKNRWSLIFIGLCLALGFSVSSVEAQMHHSCGVCEHCDRDGDELIKDTPPCFTNCVENKEPQVFIDGNDREHAEDLNICGGGDPPAFVPVQVCHFKNILKHCFNGEIFVGGGELTITSQKKLDQHLLHDGDCIGIENFTPNPMVDGFNECVNHCAANDFSKAGCS